ncbi:hypothetical protein TNCV_3988681 [Trichonephila clavipes]|nr:hypothetical protein TNCV_3988681 [Trichonephila clavipes]
MCFLDVRYYPKPTRNEKGWQCLKDKCEMHSHLHSRPITPNGNVRDEESTLPTACTALPISQQTTDQQNAASWRDNLVLHCRKHEHHSNWSDTLVGKTRTHQSHLHKEFNLD